MSDAEQRPLPRYVSALTLAALAAAVGAAALPFHRCGPRAGGNEAAAIAALKLIAAAQREAQASGAIDRDHDGIGEFGFLAELAGTVPVRDRERGEAFDLARLGPTYRNVENGRVTRSGYRLRCFLRAGDGTWLGELGHGGGGRHAVECAAAHEWLCYAWPVAPGTSGRRTFLVDQSGAVRATAGGEPPFGGAHEPQPGGAGFARVDGQPRAVCDGVDDDGVRWVAVQ